MGGMYLAWSTLSVHTIDHQCRT